ncbi:hypothetical protein [Phenylobacterium sp.]|uniref:hypothetical protein n=1 Tax=Phenylobacterium sp. TaxID=1871053 RepID=UPI002FD9D2A4
MKMRTLARAPVALALLALSLPLSAQAQAPLNENPPTQTVICLDVGGGILPVVCKAPASRLDKREDICTCPQGMRTAVPICGPGEREPADTVALNAARREAGRDGSLIGDLFEGKPMCVAPRS